MSQSATPATQKDMTSCLETFEKKKFCSFPHRHREATGKPEIGDETRGCRKTNISYETSSNFSQFVASKSTFSSGFLSEPLNFCNLEIDGSCEASVNAQHMSQNATPATKFAPCRHLTQPCQCDLQKTRNTIRLKCCACHEK